MKLCKAVMGTVWTISSGQVKRQKTWMTVAKSQRSPFFGTLALPLPVVETEKIIHGYGRPGQPQNMTLMAM